MTPGRTVDVRDLESILLARDYARELFADTGELRRSGRNYEAACPFCGKARHLSISMDKPLWRCWACNESGDWIKYLERRRGWDFKEALAYLAQAAGVDMPSFNQEEYKAHARRAEVLEEAYAYFVEALSGPSGEPVRQYLERRGYSREDVKAMGLGAYTDRAALVSHVKAKGCTEEELSGTGLLDQAGVWGSVYSLVIPWRDPSGRAIGFIGRALADSPEDLEALKARDLQKYRYTYGLKVSAGLLGWERARADKRVLLVEGVMDALLLNARELSVPAVSMGGKSLSEDQLETLESSGVQELLLALDQDQAGQDATESLLLRLARSPRLHPLVVSWDGQKDPDALVRTSGCEAMEAALNSSRGAGEWLALRTVRTTDAGVLTPRGQEQALARASEVYSVLEDPLARGDFKRTLAYELELSPEELDGRLGAAAERAAQDRAQARLVSDLEALQRTVREGNFEAAEDGLEETLRGYRQRRGVSAPEPYRLDRLREDLKLSPDSLHTGFESLSQALIPPGAVTIVAGRTGHGKTTFMLNLLVNLLGRYPRRRFAFFSYEEAVRWIGLKLVMLTAGTVLDREHNQREYMRYISEGRRDEPDIDRALELYDEWTSSGRLLLVDKAYPAEDLVSVIGSECTHGDVGAVLVDYIQKLRLRRATSEPRYVQVQRVSELLREQAVLSNVPVILGAQLGRGDKAEDKDKRVRLDNLRESGDIEQDANLVLGLYNDSQDKSDEAGKADPAETVDLRVRVLKNRGGRSGYYADLDFTRASLRIKDKDRTKGWSSK